MIITLLVGVFGSANKALWESISLCFNRINCLQLIRELLPSYIYNVLVMLQYSLDHQPVSVGSSKTSSSDS